MKSLSLILKENLEKETTEVDESRVARKVGRAVGNGARKAGKSLWSFAKDVFNEPHVSRH